MIEDIVSVLKLNSFQTSLCLSSSAVNLPELTELLLEYTLLTVESFSDEDDLE
jgi:hypothetical protein